jgi:REP element-mobilizing transposase RayT
MPRPLRIHAANAFYHVTLRGNHRQAIFREFADRQLLNAIVGRSLALYDARIHAYCWMTNHLHFLVQVGDEPLGSLMRQVASGYARAFQLKLDTTGHLFEARYFSRMVCADTHLLAALRYIHLNPVTAGICAGAAEHPWSSHAAYAGGTSESWLTTAFLLGMFSDNEAAAQAAYRKFMAEPAADWPPKDDAAAEPLSLQPLTSPEVWRAPAKPTQTLEQLVDEACSRFGVSAADLLTLSRERPLVLTRGWIGREALVRKVASLSEVSRALRRDRATLRYAMRMLEAESALPIAG